MKIWKKEYRHHQISHDPKCSWAPGQPRNGGVGGIKITILELITHYGINNTSISHVVLAWFDTRISTSFSNRPGLRNSLAIACGLLVVPITATSLPGLRSSRRVINWETSLLSWPPLPLLPVKVQAFNKIHVLRRASWNLFPDFRYYWCSIKLLESIVLFSLLIHFHYFGCPWQNYHWLDKKKFLIYTHWIVQILIYCGVPAPPCAS